MLKMTTALLSATLCAASPAFSQSIFSDESPSLGARLLPSQAQPALPPQDAGAGQAGTQAPLTPAMGAPTMGGFAISGGLPDWAFRLGPIGYPQINMKMVRANTDHSGSVGFFCEERTGHRQMAIALPGGFVGDDLSQDIMVMVGNQGAKLRTTTTRRPNPGEPTLYDAHGKAIPDILMAMSKVDPAFVTASIIYDDLHGHRVAFGLPNPRGTAEVAAKVCDGWHEMYVAKGVKALEAQSAGEAGAAKAGVGAGAGAPGDAALVLGGVHAPGP